MRYDYIAYGQGKLSSISHGVQQNLPAPLAAVPWLLACSALRARRSRTKHKRDACFVLCREALRAQLVTQSGFTDCKVEQGVTKRQVNSTLCESRVRQFT